jgi:hypothetical protein
MARSSRATTWVNVSGAWYYTGYKPPKIMNYWLSPTGCQVVVVCRDAWILDRGERLEIKIDNRLKRLSRRRALQRLKQSASASFR